MKPAPFDYHAPRSLAEATATLAAAGHGAKVLAGGQSLLPLLNMRLIEPSVLVDINRVEGLDSIALTADGVHVGATVRQADLLRHREAMAAHPLLAQALPHIAHPVIRNRGTVVGSIAHADPAAELPAVLALTQGEVTIDADGRAPRTVAAEQFFLGPLESDLRPGEVVSAVRFGALPRGASTAFVELSRRRGDYAMCGIAALIEWSDGRVVRAAVSTVGIHPTPLVVDVTEPIAAAGSAWHERPIVSGAGSVGRSPAGSDAAAALDEAGAILGERIDPDADLHASATYRRHLARVLTARALRQALGGTP